MLFVACTSFTQTDKASQHDVDGHVEARQLSIACNAAQVGAHPRSRRYELMSLFHCVNRHYTPTCGVPHNNIPVTVAHLLAAH